MVSCVGTQYKFLLYILSWQVKNQYQERMKSNSHDAKPSGRHLRMLLWSLVNHTVLSQIPSSRIILISFILKDYISWPRFKWNILRRIFTIFSGQCKLPWWLKVNLRATKYHFFFFKLLLAYNWFTMLC